MHKLKRFYFKGYFDNVKEIKILVQTIDNTEEKKLFMISIGKGWKGSKFLKSNDF